MADVKSERSKKKQLGQFMTPLDMCIKIVSNIEFNINDKVLEPSFGCGNFILSIIDKFLPLYEGDIESKLDKILNNNIWGVEMDEEMYESCLRSIINKYGYIPDKHNLVISDYLVWNTEVSFTKIIGNPPFGGTINLKSQDILDKKYGKRFDIKIKKETYSFFMVKSVEQLEKNGTLIFISSDTFLTIKTMKGLRNFLFNTGSNKIENIDFFSEETNYPMVILTYKKSDIKDYVSLNDYDIPSEDILLTDNFSWYIPSEYTKYFKGEKLSEYVIGSGGMTVGKNEYFLRDIKNNKIRETYKFTFFQDPITLEKELSKARLNKLSERKISEIKKQEENGECLRNIKVEPKEAETITLPNSDYKYYNKASNEILFTNPKTAVYWKDNGDACLTYKKCGNWYLGGVGGRNFFERECITWQLISSKINARYLDEGYILDNSSPIIVLKNNINKGELYFILGWLLTNKCTSILKSVINHTKNIQSKDIERLPYPFWVSSEDKRTIIDYIKESVNKKRNDGLIPENFVDKINNLFEYK